MTALRDMMLALSRLKATRAHLRGARENARRLDLDHLVLRHMQSLQAELDGLERTAHLVWKAEARRRSTTKKHGTSPRSGAGPRFGTTSQLEK